MKQATLIVGDWSTTCSACGGNALPSDVEHVKGGGNAMVDGGSYVIAYEGSSLDDENGCGATFVAITAGGAHLRPDLPVYEEGE